MIDLLSCSTLDHGNVRMVTLKKSQSQTLGQEQCVHEPLGQTQFWGLWWCWWWWAPWYGKEHGSETNQSTSWQRSRPSKPTLLSNHLDDKEDFIQQALWRTPIAEIDWSLYCFLVITYWSPFYSGQEPSLPFVLHREWNCRSHPNTWKYFLQSFRIFFESPAFFGSLPGDHCAYLSRSVSSTSHSLMFRYLNTAGKKLSISLRNISTDIFLYLDIGSGFCTKNTL